MTDGLKMTNYSYLKLMIKALNEESNIAQYPLTLKSLDNLDSYTFRRILIYLINQTGTCPRRGLEMDYPRYELIVGPNSIISPLVYESSLDHLYWALKELFPPHDDSVTYNLLYHPYRDPKRTKQVLSYMTSFALFCDQSIEKFDMIHAEVQEEHILRQELHEEIENCKSKASERIIYLEDQKEQLPTFVENLRQLHISFTNDKVEIAHLELAVHECKKKYDNVDLERIKLTRDLEDAMAERKLWESRLIQDPERLLNAGRDEERKVNDLLTKRDEINREIADLNRITLAGGPLIDKANSTLAEIQEGIAQAEEVQKTQDALTDLEESAENKEKLLEKVKDKLALAKACKAKLRNRLEEKQRGKIKKKENLLKKLKQTREKTQEEVQKQIRLQGKLAEFQAHLQGLEEVNKDTELKVFEALEFLEVIAPEFMKIIVDQAEQAYEDQLSALMPESYIY